MKLTLDKLKQDYEAGRKVLREISEETATWMLECVPPYRQSGCGFVNSEPYTHNESGAPVYFCCLYRGGKSYGVYATLKEWNSGALHAYPLKHDHETSPCIMCGTPI